MLTVTDQLPAYTGRVEAAQSNSRQNLVVGAAYLRDASKTIRDRILPAATEIYAAAAHRLDAHYASGTSAGGIFVIILVGTVVLAGLFGIQVLVSRRSNRTLNVPLVGATALIVVAVVAAVVLFLMSQRALVRAQRQGSDPLQVLSAGRILALRAHTDANFALIERGTGQAYVEDFERVTTALGGRSGRDGLLGQHAGIAERNGSAANAGLVQAYDRFLAVSGEVSRLDAAGDYEGAVSLSIGEMAAAAELLDHRLDSGIADARRSFSLTADDALGGFNAVAVAVTVLTVGAGFLVLYGLQRRIDEYR